MKRSGYWTGPGPGVGSFVDRTANLRAFLNGSDHYVMVDLYAVQLLTLGRSVGPDATGRNYAAAYPLTMYFTDAEYDIPFEGIVYAGGSHVAAGVPSPAPRVTRNKLKNSIGIDVDTLEMSVLIDGTSADYLPPADGNALTPRFSFASATIIGLMDGARVTLRRLFMPAHPTKDVYNDQHAIENRGDLGPGDTSLGAVTEFAGQITEATVKQGAVDWKVKSYLEKLNLQMPRNVFQEQCLNTLGDTMCGVNLCSGSLGGIPFSTTATIFAVPASNKLNFALGPLQPTEFFDFGKLIFTTGPMSGLQLGVRSWVNIGIFGNEIELMQSMPTMPNVGDTVLLVGGCQKREAEDCVAKYANYVDPADTTKGVRYRGFNRVPPPDSAV